tara:strand:+ start:8989 stop:9330 length:342 start_codon:yes stop_codon:yes gene_type:complete
MEETKMERTPITDSGAVDIDGNGNYSVVASTAAGNNFVLCHHFEDEASAKALGRKVAAAGSIDEARWSFWRTTYGSAAFVEEEAEADMYAHAIRSGAFSEDDPSIPDNIRTLL